MSSVFLKFCFLYVSLLTETNKGMLCARMKERPEVIVVVVVQFIQPQCARQIQTAEKERVKKVQ